MTALGPLSKTDAIRLAAKVEVCVRTMAEIGDELAQYDAVAPAPAGAQLLGGTLVQQTDEVRGSIRLIMRQLNHLGEM